MHGPSSRRLYEAAHNGDVVTLQEIARRYPSLLDGGSFIVHPFDRLPEPPLHVAAFSGHLDFVERILVLKPALAHHLDNRGLSPLHMAAANGRLPIITHLLQLDPHLCFLSDKHGRNPLHFAAMNGHLHALQLLIQHITATRDHSTVLNAKDNHGYTLLHFAVYNQHLETVEYLVTLETDVNALNSKGLTPLDMLTHYPTSYTNLARTEILLRAHGAMRSCALNSTTSPEIWARKKDALMVVASLIATMAFQAAVNPPGGVWQEDGGNSVHGQIAGKSIMATKNPILYTFFIVSATAAFICSLLELVLHMSNTISNSGMAFNALLLQAKYLSTLGLVAAYSISVWFLTTLSGPDVLALVILLSTMMIMVLLFLFCALRSGYCGRPSALGTVIQFPPPQ